jgi:acetolactate synthase-1/2/3 large subunit
LAVVSGLLQEARQRRWPAESAWRETLRREQLAHAAGMARLAAAEGLHPARISAEVDRHLDERAILVFDGGDFSGWVRSTLRARRPGGGQAGTMLGQVGAGLPYALGARAACPDARVVLLTGDGALGFGIMEIETAVRENLPVVVVVGNDAAWGIEAYFQEKWYGPDRLVGTRLSDVRWDQMARAIGAHGERVEAAGELGPALARAFAANGPACVDIRTARAPSPQALAFSRLFLRRRARLRRAAPDGGGGDGGHHA